MKLHWLAQWMCEHDWYEIRRDTRVSFSFTHEPKKPSWDRRAILLYKICKKCGKHEFQWGGDVLDEDCFNASDQLYAQSFIQKDFDKAMKEINKEKRSGQSDATGKKDSVS